MPLSTNDPPGDRSGDLDPGLISYPEPAEQVSIARGQLGELQTNAVDSCAPVWLSLVSDHSALWPGSGVYVRSPYSVAAVVAEASGEFDEITFGERRFLLSQGIRDSLPEDEPWYETVVELIRSIVASKRVAVSIATNSPTLDDGAARSTLWFVVCDALFSFVDSAANESGHSVLNFTRAIVEHPDFDQIKIALHKPDGHYAVVNSGVKSVRREPPALPTRCFWTHITLDQQALSRLDRILSITNKVTERLENKGFSTTNGGFSLERKEIKIALDALPRRHRRWAQYLLSENHLASKYVDTIRNSDWQLLGGLMQLSGQTQLDSGEFDMRPLESVVRTFELNAPESLCGARYSNLGKSIMLLLAGITEPEAHDLVRIAFEKELGYCPQTTALQY